MPSAYEMEELIHKCTWTWTKMKGIEGYKVTGPNGNSIFLPAGGCKRDEISGETVANRIMDYTYGYYWTDELADGMEGGEIWGKDALRAAMLFFDNDITITIGEGDGRYVGACIRPVFGYFTLQTISARIISFNVLSKFLLIYEDLEDFYNNTACFDKLCNECENC